MREIKLPVGNDLEVMVELVGDVSLVLGTGFEVVLKDTFNLPSFRRNLISVSYMDRLGFKFTFYVGKIIFMLNSQVVGNGILFDGLYKLYLDCDKISSSLNVENSISKRSKIREKSYLLWHGCLGHISKERVERLIRDDILTSLIFNYLGTCIDCIKETFIKTNKIGRTRSSGL